MARRLILPVALIAAAFAAAPAAAQMAYGRAPRLPKEPDLPPGVKIEQKIGAKVPLDLVFHDHLGREVKLAECVNGKPTILVLAYYACPKLCTEVLNGLVREMKALNRLGISAGKDYNVVTVSINPKDAPTFARMKRQSYLDEYDKRPEDEAGWWFLTASHGQGTNLLEAQDRIDALAAAVGFRYAADNYRAYDEAAAEVDPTKRAALREKAIRHTKEYIHESTIIVLTPDGTVSQYHLGLAPGNYTAEDIRKSLDRAAGGRMGTLLQELKLTCFSYDVHSGRYEPVMRVMGLLAVPVGLLVVGLTYMTVRRARREKPVAPAEAATLGRPAYVQVVTSKASESEPLGFREPPACAGGGLRASKASPRSRGRLAKPEDSL
jgi:protein SCO1/2